MKPSTSLQCLDSLPSSPSRNCSPSLRDTPQQQQRQQRQNNTFMLHQMWNDIRRLRTGCCRMLLLLLLMQPVTMIGAMNCFNCASEEYEELWSLPNVRDNKPEPAKFSNHCDGAVVRFGVMPRTKCKRLGPCLTIVEEQFIGGMRSVERPFLFLRGCAEDLLADRPPGAHPTNRPIEVQWLLENPYCTFIPSSEIWPNAKSASSVLVCSCFNDSCNIHDDDEYEIHSHHISSRAISSASETSARWTTLCVTLFWCQWRTLLKWVL